MGYSTNFIVMLLQNQSLSSIKCTIIRSAQLSRLAMADSRIALALSFFLPHWSDYPRCADNHERRDLLRLAKMQIEYSLQMPHFL